MSCDKFTKETLLYTVLRILKTKWSNTEKIKLNDLHGDMYCFAILLILIQGFLTVTHLLRS